MIISYNFINLSLDKKEEIRDIAISLNGVVNKFFCERKHIRADLLEKLHRAYAFYKKYYHARLTDEEKSIFYLYILFPNDEYFMQLIERYDKNYQEIANLFCVSANVIKLRYILQNNIMIERELENAQSKKKAMN